MRSCSQVVCGPGEGKSGGEQCSCPCRILISKHSALVWRHFWDVPQSPKVRPAAPPVGCGGYIGCTPGWAGVGGGLVVGRLLWYGL